MTTSMRMKEEPSHMTERILNFTLEIIYLLTGESYPPVKSGDQVTIMVPPLHSLKPQRHNLKKILEVTNHIAELLMGEVPIRCQNVSVYFSMEEWEYLEGHKDLYKDLIMEDHQSLQSRDRPQRSPCPLFSTEKPQEAPHPQMTTLHPQEAPPHPQGEDQRDIKVEVKEEEEQMSIMEAPPTERDRIMAAPKEEESFHVTMEDHQPLPSPGGSRDPPQRSPRPLDSAQDIPPSQGEEPRDFVIKQEIKGEESEEHKHVVTSSVTQEPQEIPHYHQGEDVMKIKVEDGDDEASVEEEQRYTEGEEPGMRRSFIEDTPTQTSTAHVQERRKTSKEHLAWPPDWKGEDEDITWSGPGEGGPPPSSKGPLTEKGSDLRQKKFSCTECGKSFHFKSTLAIHIRSHSGERPYACPECGKCYAQLYHLTEHRRSHTQEMPFTCPECGKGYPRKFNLLMHIRTHTGERPHSCSECGKSYIRKYDLLKHQRTHTRERPALSQECQLTTHRKSHTKEKRFSCPECGKCYLKKISLGIHRMSHTGEKPFPCPECGKCFSRKYNLTQHQKTHSQDMPFICPECGKGYPRKAKLVIHIRTHTGERPYSCTECGKGFIRNNDLCKHQRSHTGEKPYTCPECGKCFMHGESLHTHRKSHTREKPYSCPECGKCYKQKCHLYRHQRSHPILEVC